MKTLRIATEDKLHSAESAAVLLGVRPATIRWWWSTGRLPRLKIGRLSKVRESALLTLIGDEQTVGSNAGRGYKQAVEAIHA